MKEHVRIKKMTIPGTVVSFSEKDKHFRIENEAFFSFFVLQKRIFCELKSDVATMASEKGEEQRRTKHKRTETT